MVLNPQVGSASPESRGLGTPHRDTESPRTVNGDIFFADFPYCAVDTGRGLNSLNVSNFV